MATINLEVFFLAAQTGNIKLLQYCLDNGIDIHSGNDFALRLAAENEQIETIRFLINKGANVCALDDTLLRLASSKGKIETVQKVLSQGNCSQDAKLYSMYNAILHGHVDIIKLLLENGVSPTDNDGAVLRVVKMCRYDNVITLFEDYLN